MEHGGSALRNLLFIVVMDMISGNVSELELVRKMLYADDLTAMTSNNTELQKTL